MCDKTLHIATNARIGKIFLLNVAHAGGVHGGFYEICAAITLSSFAVMVSQL